jgi:formyltetrahydrofolate deformylase
LAEITVIGDDKTGIVAQVTSLLFERGVNIEDIDQAVRDGLFRMTLHGDTSDMVCTKQTLRDAANELAEDVGVDIHIRFPSEKDARQIALLCTKESHCLETILEAHDNGNLSAEPAVTISNRSRLETVSDEYGVPFYDIGNDDGVPDEDRLLDLLFEYNVDLVVLARYMRILGPNIVFRFEDRIINIHPSLLPAFPGAVAYRQAREEGVRVAGVTAHYVTTDLDQGPIITQRAFNVPPEADIETLKTKGQPLEADALLEAIQLHLSDDITTHRGRTVPRNGTDSDEYQFGMQPDVDQLNPSEPVDKRLE